MLLDDSNVRNCGKSVVNTVGARCCALVRASLRERDELCSSMSMPQACMICSAIGFADMLPRLRLLFIGLVNVW